MRPALLGTPISRSRFTVASLSPALPVSSSVSLVAVSNQASQTRLASDVPAGFLQTSRNDIAIRRAVPLGQPGLAEVPA
jgi:hypothetical protein